MRTAAFEMHDFSILAPHEGERHGMIYNLSFVINFSILAPHEGERLAALALGVRVWAFQSSLPTRGSDYDMQGNIGQLGKFSILAPHEGERRRPRV